MKRKKKKKKIVKKRQMMMKRRMRMTERWLKELEVKQKMMMVMM